MNAPAPTSSGTSSQAASQAASSAPTRAPATPRVAASVLFLRDHPEAGLQVLMLSKAERHGDQRSGAAVFPGGVVDAADGLAHAHCHGLDDATASRQLGVAHGGLDVYIGAARESFEEVGLLLARPAPGAPGQLPSAHTLQPWRDRLQSGGATVADFCTTHQLQLDLSGLVYCGHWLTPPDMPKRWDTRFFAIRVPADQQPVVEVGEAVACMWLTPQEALSPTLGLKLLNVTELTLRDMSRHTTVHSMLEAFSAHPVPLNNPHRALGATGPMVVNNSHPAHAEVRKLDPTGRVDAHAIITPGRPVALSPHLLRLTAPNPGPMTGPGTNTYVLGKLGQGGPFTVVDPGPADTTHLRAILATIAAQGHGAHVARIAITHTHRDHSPGVAALAAATGAPVFGRLAHEPGGQDDTFKPTHQPQHGDEWVLAPGLSVRLLHTPGHASNHLCYLMVEERTLLTGDHVMQGSTVVINPPDGDMVAYLRSLKELMSTLTPEHLHWLAPGHGFLVAQPHEVLRQLIAHRLRREAKVQAALRAAGSGTLASLVPQVYDDVAPSLHGLAQRSLLAHLLKLEHDGLARQAGGQQWHAV